MVIVAPEADAVPDAPIGVQVAGMAVPDTVYEVVAVGAAPPVAVPVDPPAAMNGFASLPPLA